jgi:hypothetical protein
MKLHASYIYACRLEDGKKSARHAAMICCKRHHCKDCGVETDHFETICRTCLAKALLREDEVVQWDGECQVWDGDDGWYPSPEEAADCSDGETFHVFPCEFKKIRLDEERVAETLCDDHHEDMGDYLGSDPDALKLFSAIKAFNENTTLGSWYPIPGKVIVIDQEKFDAYLESKRVEVKDSDDGR